MYYTSPQGYRLLLEQSPSISQGEKMDIDVVFLLVLDVSSKGRTVPGI